jgi:hypothetical protein
LKLFRSHRPRIGISLSSRFDFRFRHRPHRPGFKDFLTPVGIYPHKLTSLLRILAVIIVMFLPR